MSLVLAKVNLQFDKELSINLSDSTGYYVFKSTIELSQVIAIDQSKLKSSRTDSFILNLDMSNITLNTFGLYTILISLDNKELGKFYFQVKSEKVNSFNGTLTMHASTHNYAVNKDSSTSLNLFLAHNIISIQNRMFKMIRPLSYRVYTDSDAYFLHNKELGILIPIYDVINFSEVLLEHLIHLYVEYGLEEDNHLTSNALGLKHSTLSYLTEV